MEINKITITGIDNSNDIPELLELQKQYPFVEWGVLFASKPGKDRYPLPHVIEDFLTAGLNLSAHFCGTWAKEPIEEGNFDYLTAIFKEGFKRVQLNYNFDRGKGWDLTRLIKWSKLNDNCPLILQCNKSNLKHVDFKKIPDSFHILYDSSGGSGKEIKKLEKPFKNYTGYSGGISPFNIYSIGLQITTSTNKSKVWLDMESGVRDDKDKLDLSKVRKILELSEFLINKNV